MGEKFKLTLPLQFNHIFMKYLFLSLFILIAQTGKSQYYYNDILGTAAQNELIKTYLANHVSKITAIGYDQNGLKDNSFQEIQEVLENGTVLKITSLNNNQREVYYYQYKDGKLQSVVDSSSNFIITRQYTYDAAGRITKIVNTTQDPDNEFNQTESHTWQYLDNGMPSKMWRTINQTDSMEIQFVPTDNGLPGDENTYRRGVKTGTIYYYYDEQNRLTDIVRYHDKLKKMLPDMMFEYDAENHVIQKITTTPSTLSSYLIWRYIYDEKGLKTKDALFNKDKKLTGKIVYNYSFK